MKTRLEVGDTITCRDWEDLKKTVRDYSAAGYTCEVKGWEQMSSNTFTITGVPDEFSDYEGMPYQFDNMTGSMNL